MASLMRRGMQPPMLRLGAKALDETCDRCIAECGQDCPGLRAAAAAWRKMATMVEKLEFSLGIVGNDNG